MNQKTKITVSGILQDLEDGMTRTTTGKNYNGDIGCIQEKYNLTNYDLDMLFKHPKLKGKKTKTVRTTSFVLEDDTSTTEDETANVILPTVEEPVVEERVTENTTNLEEHVVEETTNENENTLLGGGWD